MAASVLAQSLLPPGAAACWCWVAIREERVLHATRRLATLQRKRDASTGTDAPKQGTCRQFAAVSGNVW